MFPSRRPGLYVHVPFCSAICPYCDFAVLTGGAEAKRRYVDALLREAELAAGDGWESFDTVYFGGGTPSALAAGDLARLLDGLRSRLPIAEGAWIHFEANPEDVSAASLAAWRGLGVRTLSLGVQSFEPATLRFLGRRHTAEEAAGSVALAREAGFPVVSIDLIYGSEGEPIDAWRRSLERAVALAPDHLSCYQLTIHEGTPFGFRARRGELAELPEGAQADLFLLTHTFLAAAGYAAYEVSSFARSPEVRSRHNPKYWHHVPYLGLGPSAHSFSGVRGARRSWNERKLGAYAARLEAGERPVAGSEELAPADLALESLMLGLRTAEGIDLAGFRGRWGFDLAAANGRLLAALATEGLVALEGERLVPTLAGWAVADALAGGIELGPARPSAAGP
jgi:oxygen-independent coproporphyrinogen-3 oxidase